MTDIRQVRSQCAGSSQSLGRSSASAEAAASSCSWCITLLAPILVIVRTQPACWALIAIPFALDRQDTAPRFRCIFAFAPSPSHRHLVGNAGAEFLQLALRWPFPTFLGRALQSIVFGVGQ